MRGWDEEFRGFVAAHRDRLSRFAYLQTADWHDAEDVLQDALTKVFLAWPRVRPDARLAYTQRAIVNTNRSRVRRRRLTEVLSLFLPDRQEPRDAPSDVDTRMLLVTVLQRLPPRQRAVVCLRYVEDLSEQDVAMVLGCSVGTVKSQSAKALDHLRRTRLPVELVVGRNDRRAE